MRQASEKLAVAIGMENLARTAGYLDPQRLEWAMEAEAVADLAAGPVRAQAQGVTVSLSINELGEPELAVTKSDKALKAIPAAARKDEAVSTLVDRKQKLERQISRMRLSLEAAMCRGDIFSRADLAALTRHPMLRVLIEQLIFISPRALGYPLGAGRALQSCEGARIPIRAEDRLRIAHPLDLLESKAWHLWQRFLAERIQPFKQIFRELYVLTATEKADGNLSRRYAGQQVNPRQAMALFGSRGLLRRQFCNQHAQDDQRAQGDPDREGDDPDVRLIQTQTEVNGDPFRLDQAHDQGRHGEDRSDRQVDIARHDNEHHASRHDGHGRRLDGQVPQVAWGQEEAVGHDIEDDPDHGQGQHHPQQPTVDLEAREERSQ